MVYVTVLDGGRSFYCNYTDTLGNFYIVLSEKNEEADLFVSAEHPDSLELDIYIDQDFCTEPVLLPSFPVSPGAMGPEMLTELSVNAQIQNQYGSVSDTGQNRIVPGERFFYGIPSATIYFKDFISLPTTAGNPQEIGRPEKVPGMGSQS
jgi:hypothetical protein